jgi:hypothetical protein
MRKTPLAASMAELYGRPLLAGDPGRAIGFAEAVSLGREAAEVAATLRARDSEESEQLNGGRSRSKRLDGGRRENRGFAMLADWQRASGASPTAVAKEVLGKRATPENIKRFVGRLKSNRGYRRSKVTKPRAPR